MPGRAPLADGRRLGVPDARVLARHRWGRLRSRRGRPRTAAPRPGGRGQPVRRDAFLAAGDHPDGWAVPLAISSATPRPVVNYGWCHGPAGTVRLFLALNEIDPQLRWQHAIDACLQALRDSVYLSGSTPDTGTTSRALLRHRRSRAALARPVPGHRRHRTARVGWHPGRRRHRSCPDYPERRDLVQYEHTRTPPGLPPSQGSCRAPPGSPGWLARFDALRTRRHTPDPAPRPGPSWL